MANALVAFHTLSSSPYPESPNCWLQTIDRDIEDRCEGEKLGVGDATDLCLNLRDRRSADVPSVQLAPRGKLFLGEPKNITPLLYLFANDVGGMSFPCHARARRA